MVKISLKNLHLFWSYLEKTWGGQNDPLPLSPLKVTLKFKCVERNIVLLWWFWISFLFVFIKACSHSVTCIVRFFCTIMLKAKKSFMNQWIWKELCISRNIPLSLHSITTRLRSFIKFIFWAQTNFQLNWIENLFRVKCINISERFTILRGFLSPIGLTAIRLCKTRGRLVLQMQGWVFCGSSISDFFRKTAIRKH